MNRVLKLAVISAAAAAATFAALPSAYARDGWRHHHRGGGDLVAAGILGLAVGAIAAGIATAPEPDYYYYDEPDYRYPRQRPRPVRNYYVQEPNVVYVDSLEPWTNGWYRYCRENYRTFNDRTGTFVGYDGRRHFCRAD